MEDRALNIRDTMHMRTRNGGARPLFSLLRPLALLLYLLSAPALAESYRVDLIVFLDLGASGESGRAPQLPTLTRALETGNAAALESAGIRVLPESDSSLNEHWQRLRSSKNYRPLAKLSWVQRNPPAENGPGLRLRQGEPMTVSGDGVQLLSPLDGSVRLLLGRYLHLDADLVYTQPVEGGHLSYRLNERRRMRRDELHHLDSPKLGVIARVQRAG